MIPESIIARSTPRTLRSAAVMLDVSTLGYGTVRV
jgi:hypothetical protein